MKPNNKGKPRTREPKAVDHEHTGKGGQVSSPTASPLFSEDTQRRLPARSSLAPCVITRQSPYRAHHDAAAARAIEALERQEQAERHQIRLQMYARQFGSSDHIEYLVVNDPIDDLRDRL